MLLSLIVLPILLITNWIKIEVKYLDKGANFLCFPGALERLISEEHFYFISNLK